MIWGQFSDTMKKNSKALKAYEDLSEHHSDSLKLLKEIKGILYRFETLDSLLVFVHARSKGGLSHQGTTTNPSETTGATFLEEEETREETVLSLNMTYKSIRIEKKDVINPMRILLDSVSTVTIFSNTKFRKNIGHCGSIKGLHIYTNGGTQDMHLIGDLPGFRLAWYNEGSLIHISSSGRTCTTSIQHDWSWRTSTKEVSGHYR